LGQIILNNERQSHVWATIFWMILLGATLSGCGNAFASLNKDLTLDRQPSAAPVGTVSVNDTKPLPSSMKGYELYSWTDEEGDSWHFTLITGTNRLKTVEEITADEDLVTHSEWLKITVTGTEDLKALLERLPPGTELTWRGQDWPGNEQQAATNVLLPKSRLIEEIRNHCRQLEIQLHVSQ
jgi:hypothetical protein